MKSQRRLKVERGGGRGLSEPEIEGKSVLLPGNDDIRPRGMFTWTMALDTGPWHKKHQRNVNIFQALQRKVEVDQSGSLPNFPAYHSGRAFNALRMAQKGFDVENCICYGSYGF